MLKIPRLRVVALVVFASFLGLGTVHAADGSTADDIARFLAGMPPSSGSPLARLTRDPVWQRHAAALDSSWKQMDDRQLSKVRAWSSANLKQHQPVLYYMFSGPDFLYANAFFPIAATYVLSGLEPHGNIPEIGDISASELAGIRDPLSRLFRRSFFITKEMRSQFARRRLSGTIPILYVFIARAGKTIRDVSLIALDAYGKVHPQDEAGSKSLAKGVKIVFAGSDGLEQTLYYFQTDISDGGVVKSGFLAFCEGLGTGDSFVKSGSYHLHEASFSAVRNFLIKNSAAMVQDDTGVPVRYLSAADWELHPFGSYRGAISIFSRNNQPELRQLFVKNNAAPLNFTLGYRSGAASNLLLAIKATPKTQ